MGCRVIEANGGADHLHVLLMFPTTLSIATIVNSLKTTSSLPSSRRAPRASRWNNGAPTFSKTLGCVMSANFHELIHGFHNFREEYLLKEHEFFDRLAHGQNPKTLVIACCDSRVDPAILMGCRPGDLFVVRSIAAIVPGVESAGRPDAVMAAVEYGVKHLDVHHVIVMGHSNCGGVQGMLFPEKIAEEKWIARWTAIGHPVVEELRREEPDQPLETLVRRSEEGAVLLSIENLLSYDWIRERVDAGTLSLHALYYDIRAKSMYLWNAVEEDFELVTAPH